MIGMPNASQNRMNRAAFTEALMSIAPASTFGWFPTMPTTWPPSRPSPTMMLGAKNGCTSKNSRPSSTRETTWRMSYGLFGDSGTIVCSSASARSRSSVVGTKGGRSAFDEGKYDSSLRTPAAHSCSLRGRKCATPEVALCTCPPPSSSNDTASPVTTLITSGPVMNM